MSITINISFGEFLDKLTILQIKTERITDPDKLENIARERRELDQAWQQEDSTRQALVAEEIRQLKRINEELWDIEDAIRDKERNGEFDDDFIRLARAVYVTNDRRAEVKKHINLKLGSTLIEEKSYADYDVND
ncbi:MAG: DUF6165 family protein [Thiotrichales bacterium]|nr:DUF6165 family protein [Thiotrichales bacterium]